MNKIIYFFKTTITTSSPPCEKINEKEKTKLLTVHNPMSNKTREIISSPVVLQPTLVHPSIATERRSPNSHNQNSCYFFNLMYVSPCIIYHCQYSPTEGAKAISTL